MATLFISDCHLTPERDRPFREFLDLMAGPARDLDALYILGDLFDLWLGDDDTSPGHERILDTLRQCAAGGTRVGVMRGNHDFLMGAGFEAACGCPLLDDPTELSMDGRRVLLSHGDTLCVDDMGYQDYRRWVRSEEFARDFLARPLEERRHLAADIQAHSRDAVAAKPGHLMDAAERAVADTFRRHGADLMIHGHTHRPAIHRHEVDGRDVTRIVLADWYEHGSGLLWDAAGYRPVTVADLINTDHRPPTPAIEQ